MTGQPRHDQRRSAKPDEPDGPPVEGPDQIGSRVWRFRSLATARQVLRARQATTQAGFSAEHIPTGLLSRHPILFSDGPLHDRQRSDVARFFAPKVVAERHLPDIAASADRHVAQAVAQGSITVDEVALHYAVEVTSKIVGLTASPVPSMSRRLVNFFRQPALDVTKPDLGRSNRDWMRAAKAALVPLVAFNLLDVRPAIRQRRRNPDPSSDVISQLIAEGATDLDILVECVTYGTAGMVTTREFIVMAAWHLLTDDDLKQRYLSGTTSERHRLLNEVIRLEPVVGHLYRRAVAAIEVTDGDQVHRIEPGDLLDVCVRHTNLDPSVFGDEAQCLRPGRPLPPGVDASGMTFGDGAHRCPGQALAITETDEVLTRLLRAGATLTREPELGWDDLIEGYTLRGMTVSFTGSGSDEALARSTTRDDFDHGAERYDLMVALNPGYHRELRAAAEALTDRISGQPRPRLIDLACGSGASTRALLRHAPDDAEIIGLDASSGMLAHARRKVWPSRVRFAEAVAGEFATTLPAGIEQDSLDGILTCYLFRNVPEQSRDQAADEIFGLLKPGAWLSVQEYSVADSPRARWVWNLVARAVIVPLGWLLTRDAELYRYLQRSVNEFESVPRLIERLHRAGFTEVSHRHARGWQRGILHTLVAQKPSSTTDQQEQS